MRNKCVTNHVMKRDSKYYYVRHIPKDLTQHYSIQRLCFSLKTNSDSIAVRYSKSITQSWIIFMRCTNLKEQL